MKWTSCHLARLPSRSGYVSPAGGARREPPVGDDQPTLAKRAHVHQRRRFIAISTSGWSRQCRSRRAEIDLERRDARPAGADFGKSGGRQIAAGESGRQTALRSAVCRRRCRPQSGRLRRREADASIPGVRTWWRAPPAPSNQWFRLETPLGPRPLRHHRHGTGLLSCSCGQGGNQGEANDPAV